jgi:hypothetical protein
MMFANIQTELDASVDLTRLNEFGFNSTDIKADFKKNVFV